MNMQSRYNLDYSLQVREDLLDIQDYIANKFKDFETATKKVLNITKAARYLETFPKMYRVRYKDRFGNEIRICPVDNYSILYFVNDAENVVNISRVLYGRRDIDSLP